MNPKLVTLPGGAVQTSTTEKPFDDVVQTTSTTPRTTPRTTPKSTTTYRPIITTTPYRPIEIKTSTYRPIEYKTTTYRPIEIRTTTYRPLFKFDSVAATQNNKPFNVFDFYRTLYNPTKPPPLTNTLKPFVVNRPQYQAPAVVPSPVVFHQKPVVSQPLQQNIIPSVPVLRVEPKPVAVIPSPIIPTRVSTINEVKSVPVVVVPSAHPVQTLEKNVAPPLAADHPKATFSPRVNVQLVDSGHKFINRFVVDEDTIREDGLLPVKTRLEKDIVAPPVNNVRPILSPKISVHVGETGYKFINRFVLTEDEKKDQYGISGKSAIKGAPVGNAGQTAFTSRFDVDDVNKKLFQIKSASSESQPIRAPQSKILFNNRFDEGVNHFHYRPEATQATGRTAFGSVFNKQPVAPFTFNSQLSFKKTYH